MRDEETKREGRVIVLVVLLVILVAVILAAMLVFSHNEGLVRCRDRFADGPSRIDIPSEIT